MTSWATTSPADNIPKTIKNAFIACSALPDVVRWLSRVQSRTTGVIPRLGRPTRVAVLKARINTAPGVGGSSAPGGARSLRLPRRDGGAPAGLVPDGAVSLLIERRAAGGELPERVVLAPHQRRAIAERAASPLRVDRLSQQDVAGEARLSQRGPAHT